MRKIIIDNKWTFIFFIVNILVFSLFGNRSIFVGSILSYFIIKRSKHKIFWLSLAIICTLGLTFFVKEDSSLGRVFVYKISFSIFKNNWLYGCGLGEFGRVYLQEQAKYFSLNSFDLKELLLADNTIYAFNDWFQFICETGVVGIISVSIFCYSLYCMHIIFDNIRFFWPKVIFLAILISAFFTHVFENQFIVLFLLTIFFSVIYNDTPFSKRLLHVRFLLAAALIWGLCKEIKSFYLNSQLEEAINLSNSGQFYRSNLLLDNLRKNNNCNYECLFFYSRNSAKIGEVDNALKIMINLTKHRSSSLYYSLLADLYIEKDNLMEAERNLIHAIHMVPNRFEERHKLLEIYQRKKDTNQVNKVAMAIINLPVKFNSDRIEFIKKYSNQILNKK